ncbi:MAG: Rieske 2Fe-2S domain-containing protein [Sandaracinaceae bacterium]|nr:Rieske 2Fe-2S domain-containing protein [Sandaracinaceae bacterium]
MSGARFPFGGSPRGWFAVALGEDLPREGVIGRRYFGRELALYRGASGRAYVTDAFCPHLGAHLAHGGVVEGEALRCPFHGWRFGEGGRCDDIPYTDKIPPKARLAHWPVVEQAGVVLAFHDPSGGAPWALPSIDEAGWTEGRAVLWSGLRTHPQEVFENTVDMAHLGPVHGGRDARLLAKPAREGERFHVELEFTASGAIVGMPDQENDVHLAVTLSGLGWAFVETHVRNVGVRARQRIFVTPIDEERVDIRGLVHVADTGDAAFTAELHALFYGAFVEDFAKDFPIWEHKRYLERPMVTPGDGPIGAYRRWCAQFYLRDAAPPQARERAKAPRLLEVLRGGLGGAAATVASARARVAGLGGALASVAARERAVRAPNRANRPAPSERAASLPPRAPEPADEPASCARPPGAPAALPARVESVEEYFSTLDARFVPAAAAGLDAVFQWELDGPGGGVFHARVRDGELEIGHGPHPDARVRLAVRADDYVRIVNGELDGVRAFASGRSKVHGDLGLAMKMRALFPA